MLSNDNIAVGYQYLLLCQYFLVNVWMYLSFILVLTCLCFTNFNLSLFCYQCNACLIDVPSDAPIKPLIGAPSDVPSESVFVFDSDDGKMIVKLQISNFGSLSNDEQDQVILDLENISRDSILLFFLLAGVILFPYQIRIESIVTIPAAIESRSLQDVFTIVQDITIDAPVSTISTDSIDSNIAAEINNAVASGNTYLEGVSAQTSIVPTEFEQPYWPCSGVTCSNAGKCEVSSPTTALCKCENTFVPSESGLECICTDGLEFHTNMNRCLPPPTVAPSDLPSAFPSLTPSMVPSNSKIDDDDTPACFDDVTSTFKLFNIMEEVECTWLTKNEKKTNVRKNKYCVIEEVKSLCQSTCGECTACNDNEGTFTLLNMKKRETCAWLTKNKGKAEKRKRRYCALNNVSNMCKLSCDVCSFEEESGRV